VWWNAARSRKNQAEVDFLALGDGARFVAGGGRRGRSRPDAGQDGCGGLADPVAVDWALGHAAVNARFGERDLASILAHHARTRRGVVHQAGEDSSLAQGTKVGSALPGPAGPELKVTP
jgi:hypothetical protein